ncbi:MAG: hypothetical protein EAZ95_17455 [Bacteroidetes bacterium]|nr:MAG: hypothetical protein EAZ95_17455 [Bacteroidota bacterium]
MKKSLLFSFVCLWVLLGVSTFTACDRIAVDEQPAPKPTTQYKTKAKAPIAIDLSKNHTLTSQTSLTLKGTLSHGTAQFVGNGLLIYSPANNVTTATETISYDVCMNNNCATYQVQVAIVPQNTPTDSTQGCVQLITDVVNLNVVQGVSNNVLVDVLANDFFCSTAQVDTTTLAVVVAPQRGTVYNIGSKFLYSFESSAQSQANPDIFVYKLTQSNPNVVHYGVVAVNLQFQAAPCPLTVNNDSYNVTTPTALNIFANDSFCTDSLTTNSFQVVTQPSHGTLSNFTPYTGITFAPTAGYAGADSFVYKLTYSNGSSKQGTVSLNITSSGCSVTTDAKHDSTTVPKTQMQGDSIAFPVLVNDVYCPQNIASFQITQQPNPSQGVGTFTIVGNNIVYKLPTNNPSFVGTVFCTYQICAGGSCDTAYLKVTITN